MKLNSWLRDWIRHAPRVAGRRVSRMERRAERLEQRCRSLFSQMVPQDKEAEFFSIYEISERGTSWMGPFLFAAVNQSLGNLRPAILSVVIFFVVGLILLARVNVKQAMQEAQRR